MSLVRRASAIETELEQMEGRLSCGETVDLDAFTRAAGHLRRILETLGLERRQRELPSLEQYLDAHNRNTTGTADARHAGEIAAAPEFHTGDVPIVEETALS